MLILFVEDKVMKSFVRGVSYLVALYSAIITTVIIVVGVIWTTRPLWYNGLVIVMLIVSVASVLLVTAAPQTQPKDDVRGE